MIWFIESLRIYLEERWHLHCYVIKLLKIQNRIDIKEVLRRWFITFPIKSLSVALSKVKRKCQTKNYLAEELHKPIIKKN